MKLLYLKFIRFYQVFISPFLGQNCRYYPSCSQYALLLFKYDNAFLAFFKSSFRILSCNPLFKGGFQAPFIYKKGLDSKFNSFNAFKQTNFLTKPTIQSPQKVTYFLIKSQTYLLKSQKFYIISIYIN
ncbi:membrane protein insertion efficiency factor YidD [Helicobacter saguini]|uniref:Putative membrane protein insertion efficiency factor n=1 Tax=Helicobacter saguini TaxID=1548018 RepID=A0A6L7DHV6_9HELI|nr:membrane protein insertion efficiency factor YidD [Helicobacter saguini]MWV67555.1 membrane protein insertion efficiency factor YidD [Helicobacter saguini]MWV69906.1 membrane protein insertion efficiency factor YidD [Helicobacter saguini]